VESGPLGARPGEFEDLNGVRQALDRDRPTGRDLNVAFGELQGGGGEQDRPWRRELLHAGGQVRRLANGRVVHVQIGPDGADDHLTGVEPHADVEGYPVRPEHALRVLRDCLLHPQRRIARAHGMILVSERCPEQRHNPVAHHLVHRALVAVNGLHHSLEDRVEDLARFLRIAICEQLHRAFQIGEEDGHLLALAFKRALRGEDLLGEVLRGV
jgi:hypothetical protein